MRFKTFALSLLATFVFVSIADADDLSGVAPAKTDLYDSFKNPPADARPFVHWDWPAKLPGDKEIIKQIDAFKACGFGGVEIAPAEITQVAAKSLKFASDEAKKRALLVDLALPWPALRSSQSEGGPPSAPSLEPNQCIQAIAMGRKILAGPAPYHANVNNLIKFADQTRNLPADPNARLMFLRLIPLDPKRFTAGDEFISKIQPNGLPGVASAKFGLYRLQHPRRQLRPLHRRP